MKKRLISAAVAAAATVLATPGASQAIVSSDAETGLPQFNGTVNTIIHHGNVVYVGGDFTRATDDGRTVVRKGAAAYNRLTGDLLPWKPTVKGSVHDMAWSREGVYLVGQFNRVKKKRVKNVALVSSTGAGKVKRMNVKTVGPVYAVSISGRQVYLGGGFTRVQGKPRARLASFARKSGRLSAWVPKANEGPVMDLKATNRGVYIGGYFHALNNKRGFQRFGMVDRAKGKLITTFNPKTGVPVITLNVTSSVIYAGLGGPRGGGLEAVARTTGTQAWERRLDGDVQAISVLNGTIYAGGHFNSVCHLGAVQDPDGSCQPIDRDQRFRGASFDPAGNLTAWNPRANTEIGIQAMDAYGDTEQLLIGGAFTELANNPVFRFAAFLP